MRNTINHQVPAKIRHETSAASTQELSKVWQCLINNQIMKFCLYEWADFKSEGDVHPPTGVFKIESKELDGTGEWQMPSLQGD